MTEQEAKTKWCSAARADRQGPEYATANRDGFGRPDGACLCIGSACMAWRWEAPEPAHLPPGEYPPGEGWVKGEMWKDGRYQQWERRVSGYCGLAGKP